MVDMLSAEDEREIRTSLRKTMSGYTDEYWMRHDMDHEFPWDFHDTMAEAGWIGICIPEEYGGGGAGVQEAALLLEEVTGSGGALNAGTTVQVGLFGLEPIVKHGSEEQKRRFLPKAAEGKLQVSFGVTEPDAGTETTNITTFAEKVPGGYKVNGRKVFISRAEQADRLLLITRTAPRDASPKATDGMTLFFTEMNRDHIKVQPIPKLGRNAVSTNMLFIDDLFIPEEDRIGEEGKGFKYLLAGLNAERIIVAGGCLGMGRAALRRATEYVKQRRGVRPADRYEPGHPVPAGRLLGQARRGRAAHPQGRLDVRQRHALRQGGQRGQVPRVEWAFEACDRAMQVHGGYGYTSEYHVERYWRESRVQRIAPISNELVLAYLAKRSWDCPGRY